MALVDANGNRTSSTYDLRGSLTVNADPLGALTTYGADGLRRSLVNSSGTTQFVWDGQNVLVDTDGSGATQGHYTDSPGEWGGLVGVRQAGVSHFFAFDPSENARALTDGNGNVTDTYVYTAFGDEKN